MDDSPNEPEAFNEWLEHSAAGAAEVRGSERALGPIGFSNRAIGFSNGDH
jgi:hypothetical protein